MAAVTIVGATTWGNTLGELLARRGIKVRVLTRTEIEAEKLNQKKQNPYPSRLNLPSHLTFISHIDEAIEEANLVIWAVPSQSLRQNVIRVKDYLSEAMVLISAVKGLEVDTGRRMSEVMAEAVASNLRHQICVLSGPNLAPEIAQGLPCTSVVASQNRKVAETAQQLLDSPDFRVFISEDVIGVELGGTLKNIIALGAGMIDELGLGDNCKAAFITLGWAEAISLGVALGAKTATFYGLAGLGDLIATCASPLSRNHWVGREVAKGRSLAEITAFTPHVAEGINTTMAARKLGQKLGLEMPITDLIYRVLFEALPPDEAFAQFKKLKLKPVA